VSVKYVYKRNGSKEEFNVSKILKWELWACSDIKEHIDWKQIIASTVSNLKDGVTTRDIQNKLIETCSNKQTWFHSLVAGRLYTSLVSKDILDTLKSNSPDITIREGACKHIGLKDLHSFLIEKGLMVKLDYTDEEYKLIENIIDHDRDFDLSYFQIKHIVRKYGLSDKHTGIGFETPQFTFMRMAMSLAEDEDNKLEKVEKFYTYLSKFKMNAPTPNYANLGTSHNGYISCCLYTTDDSAKSLAIGDHIAYTMTYMSAGIGGYLNLRSISDPVKNGLITHMGKLPYYKSLGAAVNANLQSSRGGACTTYYSVFDPEVRDITFLQNPRTPIDKQNRDLHYAVMFNTLFIEKVYKNEDIFLFNTYSAPDLTEAFFSSDKEAFYSLYKKYEDDETFKKTYINARELALDILRQCHEVATLYLANIEEINTHTSFKEKIYSSNLCLEITQPTKPYTDILDLYTENDDESKGEISLCALGGIIPSNIVSDEEYEDVAYYTLLMIDKCIHKNDYVFPHLKTTALKRLNAGVGLIGIAYDMAKEGKSYRTKEGLRHLHKIAERHSYYVIKASLRLGKEKGNAEWMHKTKWPDGWLPIDDCNKEIDKVTKFKYNYDWESLRKEIIENKGIRNSSLIAHMPTESSSKATGLPNGIYPIRDFYLKKTDSSNAIDFIVKENDTLELQYDIAWSFSPEDICRFYSIFQKFADQSISADFYIDRTKETELKATRLLEELFYMYKYGIKTRYYTNSKTTLGISLSSDGKGCSSGGCSV
jgi:ribonucleoside-diphosphate reductase alpha chain